MSGEPRTGGRLLVDQLRLHGVDVIFGVPGESYLLVLDALCDVPAIRYVTCRQEGGAAMMADAYGKLTGRPGIVFATRGPGATNASAGVHVAQQDGTPLILFVGQIERDARGRGAFQEIDFRQMFGGIAKWAAEIDGAARIPELVHRAFMTATSGRPGPVVLALPEDMLRERAAVADGRPWQAVEAAPAMRDLEALQAMLAAAVQPVMILGGSGWDGAAVAAIARFAAAHELPVACAFRRQDLIDNEHPCYIGDLGLAPNPKLIERIRAADLILAVGTRLGEIASQGYTLLDLPRPRSKLVHILSDPAELGRVYQADLPILVGMRAAAEALAALPPPASRPWAAPTAAAREDYLAWRQPTPIPGAVQLGEIVAWLRQRLPEDAIVANGAGNYAGWVNRFFPYRGFKTQLAPTSGSMGYGLPAAIAAKLAHPERAVVCFAGDGCFLMTGQELATAVHHRLKLVVVVVNNGMYGTIRMHQEREHPERVIGTALTNPDFAALARAYGAHGARVGTTAAFAPAFETAMAQDGPALIEVMLDPEAITPRTSLSEIRAAAKAAGR